MKTPAKVTRLLFLPPQIQDQTLWYFRSAPRSCKLPNELDLSSDDFELTHQFERLVALRNFLHRQGA